MPVGGNQAEDTMYYNRLKGLILQRTSQAHQSNYQNMGFGVRANLEAKDEFDEDEVKRFAPSDEKTVCMPIMSGIFQSGKWIPLAWAGMVLEFELAEPTGVCRTGSSTAGSLVTTYTSSYTVSDVQLKCDILQVDNQPQEEISRVLQRGRDLRIH